MGTNYNFHHDNHHLNNYNLVNDHHYVYDHDFNDDNDDDHGAPHYVDIVNDDDYSSADAYYLKHKYNVDLASSYDDQFHHDRTHNYTVHDAPSNNHLFNNFYNEFNEHYNHDNDDDRTATAIDYVNEHDYDHVVVLNDDGTEYHAPARCDCGRYNPCRHHERPDNDYIDNFYDDFYFNHFHDGACDEHLVNKHHNYD